MFVGFFAAGVFLAVLGNPFWWIFTVLGFIFMFTDV